ncbi:MAG: hypothetical protein V2I97_15335 [Desulfococcaceae bacterium]|jgi:hypothetical protein|nr:hypothetical protein [Desulfococcaceae bacterium]
MKKYENEEEIPKIPLPLTKTSDLRGKQSVRATFKLSENAINTITTVAIHLGIKQKSLFDHLIEDIASLEQIAREIRSHEFMQQSRVQKTYVLSRRTLSSLEKACENFNAPRDALVEYSIRRLIPVIAGEREKHRKRKIIFAQLGKLMQQKEELLQEARRSLGKEDPMLLELERFFAGGRSIFHKIQHFVEKGEIIESFDFE